MINFNRISLPFFFFLILILSSCAPKEDLSTKKIPSGIIQPDTLAAMLADLQITEAALRQLKRDGQVSDSISGLAFEKVFLKHKSSREMLEKSITYYEQNLEIYEEIYGEVITRLTRIQTELSGSE